MKRVAIKRRAHVSRETFEGEHLIGAGTPVIVTDAVERWPAYTKWTFEYLQSAYGDDTIVPSTGLRRESFRLTKLGDFFDYLATPDRPLRGLPIDPATGLPIMDATEPASPWYLMCWGGLRRHPELQADIEPYPEFIDDWLRLLPEETRLAFERLSGASHTAVFIGPPGTVSPLHADYDATHAWLGQVRGRKQCCLFSPEDSEYLYKGKFDPEVPDLERFPLLAHATCYEATIEEGELLVMPSGWWHHVRALDKSITVSHNFFNRANFAKHMTSLVSKMPSVAEAEPAPAVRLG